MILDKVRHVICQDSAEKRLSPAEFIVVDALFRRQGGYVTRDTLVANIWRNTDTEPNDPEKLITVYIWRIRRKMKRIGTSDRIVTGWRDGYRLEQADV
jgi:DNA-binding response OmpR family regulator